MAITTLDTVTLEGIGADDMTGGTDEAKMEAVATVAGHMATYFEARLQVWVDVEELPDGTGYALTTDEAFDPDDDLDVIREGAYAYALNRIG